MKIDALVKGVCCALVIDDETFLRVQLNGDTPLWYIHNEDYASWVAILDDDVYEYERLYIERNM